MSAPQGEQMRRHAAIPESDRKCVTACCCEHCALYTKWPDCCGAEESCSCCFCIECQQSIKCCQWGNAAFVKNTGQCFCFDTRCALPCDHEVPCQIACLGITCYKACDKKADVAPTQVPQQVAVVQQHVLVPAQQPMMVQQPVMMVQQQVPQQAQVQY